MASPIVVGTIAIIAVAKNTRRDKVRFQNTGATQTLYFTRQIGTVANTPSVTNYDFLLAPGTAAEVNESYIETNSISQFNVVSSAAAGSLAIFETIHV
jgi:hypothetical protein